MTTQENSTRYFDLHTRGIGYLNRARVVPVKRGQSFLAVDVAALHGAADDIQHTYFDCRVSVQEAQALVQAYLQEIRDGKAVLVAFNIGDIYPELFVYEKGPKQGQTGVSLKGRLLRLDWIKIDGAEVYRAPPKDAVLPEHAPARRAAA